MALATRETTIFSRRRRTRIELKKSVRMLLRNVLFGAVSLQKTTLSCFLFATAELEVRVAPPAG